MRQRRHLFVSVLLALGFCALLPGCSKSPPTPAALDRERHHADAAHSDDGQSTAPAEDRHDDLLKAIQAPQDKARAVQDELQESEDQQRKAIEDQGG